MQFFGDSERYTWMFLALFGEQYVNKNITASDKNEQDEILK